MENKKLTFVINAFYFFIVIAICYVILRFAKEALMPFVFAFIIGSLLRPLNRYIYRVMPKINKKLIATFTVIVFFVVCFFIVILSGAKLIDKVSGLFSRITNSYKTVIEPALIDAFNSAEIFIQSLSPGAAGVADELTTAALKYLSDFISGISLSVLGFATSIATALPGGFFNTIICMVSTFFISADFDSIIGYFNKTMPEKTVKLTTDISSALGDTLKRYFKSYILIMSITFSELTFGMLLLKVPNPAFVAMLIAFLDILPILGTGTVLNPWAIICLLKGDYIRALSVFIIYLTITFVRNFIEPKIVGDKVGLHPLVTLIAMIAGLKLIGPVGLLAFPILFALLKDLNNSGVINLDVKTFFERMGNS